MGERDGRYKVSVIVPVYNSEKYLVNCLSYLVNQTLPEIEIITVDDGSTDMSGAILEECRRQYPDKVKVIRNSLNRGPGGARNVGIAEASGEYIGFVDNDDQVDPDMYKELYEKAKASDADIVDAAFIGSVSRKAFLTTGDSLCGKLNDDKRSELMCAKGYLWSKIYRRMLFFENSIRLIENSPFDDSAFLVYIYAYAASVENVKRVLYIHREHGESYSHNLPLPELTEKWYECIDNVADKLFGVNNGEKYREVFEYRVFDYYVKLLNAYLVSDENVDNHYPYELKKFTDKYLRDYENNRYIRKLVREEYITLAVKNRNPGNLISMRKLKK